MKKWKFVSMEPGFEPVLVDSFMEAWEAMYQWAKKLLDSGQMSYQVLETAIWIEQDPALTVPIFFYDARDRAITEGWKPD